MQPRIVPAARIIVPYDARRAASATLCPSRTAICVTDAGTYTDPAHSPMIETKTSSELTMVRRAYVAEKSMRNAWRIDGRVCPSHRADSCTP